MVLSARSLALLTWVAMLVSPLMVAPAVAQMPVDYDTDNDGLIEIRSLDQLNAIRWDLDGNGTVADADTMNYRAAFPYAVSGMGCPSPCKGYELGTSPRPPPSGMGTRLLYNTRFYTEAELAHLVTLDFDENTDGRFNSEDSYWNSGAGWVPIGTSTDSFTAIFNGNNNFIMRLFIDRGTTDNVGLFGTIGNAARIDSLNLAVDVTGQNNVGGLVGSSNGTISSCAVSGRVEALGNAVGGLIGSNSDTVTTSYARIRVRGIESEGIGGLIGSNSGTVIASYVGGYGPRVSTLDSISASSKVGGLIGDNSGTVAASYSTSYLIFYQKPASGVFNQEQANVGNPTEVGGLIGSNSGTVTASYWDTETSGQSSSSGGTGRTTTQLQGVTSATGIYSAWDDMTLDASGTNNDDPWDFGNRTQYPVLNFGGLLASRQFFEQPIDYDTDDDGLIEIASTPQLNAMRLDVNGDGIADAVRLLAANPINAAVLANQYRYAFPRSAARMGCATGCTGYELANNLSFDANGDGSFTSLDNLSATGQTDLVIAYRDYYGWVYPNEFNALDPDDQARFVLLVDTYGFFEARFNTDDTWLPFNIYDTYNDDEGWEPIQKFAATFNGNNHTISHLLINRPGEINVGLFGITQASARIDSVKLTQVRVIGLNAVGGLVGNNRGGSVTASSVTGYDNPRVHLVKGELNIGGLIGYNEAGTVTASYATGVIKGNTGTSVGGLIGYSQDGTIINSHATGSIIGGTSDHVGGLIGNSFFDNITACYAQSDISTVGNHVGGLIGYSDTDAITASYATGSMFVVGNRIGGLLGLADFSTVTASYAASAVIAPFTTDTITVAGQPVQRQYYVTGHDTVFFDQATSVVIDGDVYFTNRSRHSGGLIGENNADAVTNSYWDTEFSLVPDTLTARDGPLGKTTTQLTSPTDYTGIYSDWNLDLDDATGNDNPWDFGSTHQHPVLRYGRTQAEINAQHNAQAWKFRVQGVEVTPGAGHLRVSWTARTGATSYKVQWRASTEGRHDPATRQAVTSGTSHTIPNLVNGTLYLVRVIATIANTHDGSPSLEVLGTPTEVSDTPGLEPEPDPDTEPTFTESLGPQSYPQGRAIDPLILPEAIDGNGIVTYSLPDLPAGLTFDAETRTVSGTPTEAVEKAIYTLTATDEDGDAATMSFFLTVIKVVEAEPIPPSFGDTTVTAQVYVKHREIDPLTLPEASGGDGSLTYALTPDLPEGLTFDAETRMVSGTPAEAMDEMTYTLTATDEDEATLSFSITVIPAFGDTTAIAQVYVKHREIDPLTLPEASGGDSSLTYALAPDLPEGLTFDAETRMVSGTPIKAMDEMTYTLTATYSNGGEVHLMFTLEIPDLMPTFGDTTVAAQAYVKHREIDPLMLPAAIGGDGTLVYILLPFLPDGLSFDPTTRILSGMPTEEKSQATYTLGALDVDGDLASLTFTIEVSLPPPDIDGDGQVNFADFLTFAGKFGSRLGEERYDARCDFNGDGEIGFDDFLIFAASFGPSG